MSRDRVQEALKIAAKPTLADMRAERKKLPRPLRPLVTYLANHLFDPSLNATRAWAGAANNDHSLSATAQLIQPSSKSVVINIRSATSRRRRSM